MNFLLRSVPPWFCIPFKSNRMLDNISHPPAFVFAQRPTLLYKDNITDLAFVGVIMGHILRALPNKLAVKLMPHFPFHKDNNTLVHGVADDGTLARLSSLARVTHTFHSPVDN